MPIKVGEVIEIAKFNIKYPVSKGDEVICDAATMLYPDLLKKPVARIDEIREHSYICTVMRFE